MIYRRKRSLRVQSCCTCLKLGKSLEEGKNEDRKISIELEEQKSSEEKIQNIIYDDTSERKENDKINHKSIGKIYTTQ